MGIGPYGGDSNSPTDLKSAVKSVKAVKERTVIPSEAEGSSQSFPASQTVSAKILRVAPLPQDDNTSVELKMCRQVCQGVKESRYVGAATGRPRATDRRPYTVRNVPDLKSAVKAVKVSRNAPKAPLCKGGCHA